MPGQPRLHSRLHSWLLLMPPNALLPTASAGAGLVGCYAQHLPQSVSAWEAWEALHQGWICNTAGLGMVKAARRWLRLPCARQAGATTLVDLAHPRACMQ